MSGGKPHQEFIECVDPKTNLKPVPRITGTVNLIEDGRIILIPQPTADPRGMPLERNIARARSR